MARPLRFEYPGALYHVMARGDGGRRVYETDADGGDFLARLGRVCESHGWRVHAWVLMPNHFHLLLETREANLVSGMKVLLGGFSQGWNRRRERHGHVFQGRYKSVPVHGEGRDEHYFRTVADYIHLNPARAEMAGGKAGPLVNYRWSSLPAYARGQGPEWLEMARVLKSFDMAQDQRGRRAYVAWLEARAANDGGKVDEAAMKALRRGWYLGGEGFRDRLLNVLEALPGTLRAKSGSRAGEAQRDHGVAEAERLLDSVLPELGLPVPSAELATLRKGDPRKVLAAAVLRRRTSVSNPWLAQRLGMGHPGSVSRVLGACLNDPARSTEIERLAGCENAETPSAVTSRRASP